MHQVGFCKLRSKQYSYSRTSECIGQHSNAETDSTCEDCKDHIMIYAYNRSHLCKFKISHWGEYLDYCILGCDAV